MAARGLIGSKGQGLEGARMYSRGWGEEGQGAGWGMSRSGVQGRELWGWWEEHGIRPGEVTGGRGGVFLQSEQGPREGKSTPPSGNPRSQEQVSPQARFWAAPLH